MIPKNTGGNPVLKVYEMEENQFGFAAGDRLIVQTNFSLKEVKPNSLVFDETISDITTATLAKKIVGVVVAFQREVVR